MLVILEITMPLVSIKKPLYQCNPPYTKGVRVSSHRVLYLIFLSTYNICIIYLHVIQACLKGTIGMFHFCHLKNPSDVMKDIVNSISIYSWKKIPLLTNIRIKYVIRKINLSFSDVMKNSQIFPSKVCHFQYDQRFLFSKETGNIRAYKEVRLKMNNNLGRVFPAHFL